MRPLTILVAALLLLPCLSPAQTNTLKVIAVIGSSTAAGQGASSGNKSWVGLLQKYYQDLGVIDHIYNYASSGLTTFDGLPGSHFPNTNVLQALSVHPDVVLVAFPTNDFVVNPPNTMATYMTNLRTIYSIVVAAGAKCYITGTQPRNDVTDPAVRQLFKDGEDSIEMEFPNNSIDFWDLLADPVTLGTNPLYANADKIHPNDAGHELLFEAVKAKDILGLTPLPLSLISFTAALNGQSALLQWTAADESGPYSFIVQRSADGSSFTNLEQINGISKGLQTDYSWIDQDPLTGRNFYRLKMQADGNEQYSKVVSLIRQEKGLNILKLYRPNGSPELMAEISIDHDQPLTITITNALGARVRQTSCPGIAPLLKIPISLTGLASGQYFLTVRAAGNDQVTRSFLTF